MLPSTTATTCILEDGYSARAALRQPRAFAVPPAFLEAVRASRRMSLGRYRHGLALKMRRK
jgi:hypothetical protein